MDTSILLARLIGPLFAVIGVGVLLNPAHYAKTAASFLKDAQLYYFSGAMAFVIGMALILHHNLWVADWRVTITIIGWISLLKGIGRLLFPTAGSKFAASFAESQVVLNVGAIVVLLFGLLLTYKGFRA